MNQSTTTLIEALSAQAYTDEDVFCAERDAIFARSWQYVGHVEALRQPGDFFVCEVAGESLIVMRADAGAVNAFYNVCAHRAARLLDGAGCKQRFACPYHGWTYDSSGALLAAPNAQNVSGFDPAAYRLRACRVELHHGLVFVNLDDAATPLADQAPELLEDLERYAPDLPALTFVHRTETLLEANWKVAIENYAECYHCELIHKTLTGGVLDMSSYHIKVFDASQRHLSRAHAGADSPYDFGAAAETGFVAWWLWPGFAFQSYPGGRVHLWRWTPLAVDRTHLAVDWYFPSAELADWERELIEHHAATTFAEDQEMMASVQRGLRSRAYDSGPLMIDAAESQYSEHAVAAIQNLWRDAMGDCLD